LIGVAVRKWIEQTTGENKLERMEEQIREKTIELDHDPRCEGKPNGSKNRSSGEKLLHGFFKMVDGLVNTALRAPEALKAQADPFSGETR